MKEQRPPVIPDYEIEAIERDPNRQYRYVGTDKDGIRKLAKRKSQGYRVDAQGEEIALMSCDKDQFLARQKQAMEASAAQRKSQKMRADDGVTPVKHEVTDTNEIAIAMRHSAG